MSYCDIDGELAEVYWAEVRTSRTVRECEECRGPILAGEKYERARMIQNGQPSVALTCARCLPMAQWVMRNCGCRLHGDLWRHLVEDVFCDMRGCLPPGVHFKVGRWLVERHRRSRAAVGGGV